MGKYLVFSLLASSMESLMFQKSCLVTSQIFKESQVNQFKFLRLSKAIGIKMIIIWKLAIFVFSPKILALFTFSFLSFYLAIKNALPVGKS